MIRVAVPNKGALSEETLSMLKEAGYRCKRMSRELMISDTVHGIDFIFLRPRDIAIYVAKGIVTAGITGRDLSFDSKTELTELLPLQFGGSKFCYAVPNTLNITPDQFEGKRIATSYPNIVKADMEKRGLNVNVVKLDGAVEISIELGVADAIADVVESGMTLKEAGLKVIGEPVMISEAILVGKDASVAEIPEVKTLIDRFKGILVARRYAMIEYDIPVVAKDQACAITPGIESPTISPLSNPEWVAVKSMIESKCLNQVMDDLKTIGAKGIIVTDIRSCRL